MPAPAYQHALEPRGAPGTDTTTVWITVHTTPGEPHTAPAAVGGTVTISVFQDLTTTVTLFPAWLTYTLTPSPTTLTERLTTTALVTLSPSSSDAGEPSTIVETRTQTITTAAPTATETITSSSTSDGDTDSSGPTSATPTSTSSEKGSTGATPRGCNPADVLLGICTSASPTPTGGGSSYIASCEEGASRYSGTFKPTPQQVETLWVMAVYLLAIAITWNLVIVRDLLAGCKMLAIGWHELGHVVGCWLSLHPVERVSISPIEGGGTFLPYHDPLPAIPLLMGYGTSIATGCALMFCGFDVFASKAASIIVMASLFVVLVVASGFFSRLIVVGTLGLCVGLWFVEDGAGIRLFVLFLGVMNSFYMLFDIMDDMLAGKKNPSCVVLMSERMPELKPRRWALVWMLIILVCLTGTILAALARWRDCDPVDRLAI